MDFSTRRACAGLLLATALTGCGGGGGDSPATPPPQANGASTPLPLDASNAALVASIAPATGEGVLTVVQFAVDSARRFARPGQSSPVSQSCPNGGLLTVTLLDRDGNGIASAGDRVSIEARDCGVPVVNDIVSGTIDIDLGIPATGAPAGSLAGSISLGSGITLGAAVSTGTTIALRGSVLFAWRATDWMTSLQVMTSAADDLRLVALDSGTLRLTESIRAPALSRTVRYDEARAVVLLAYRYESEALDGSVSISTPEPLLAYLNTFPDAGRVEVTGAARSKLVLTPNFVSASDHYNAALDTNGDGTADSVASLPWTGNAIGYLWWDGTTPPYWGTPAFQTRSFSSTDFTPSLNFDWTGAATTGYRLQFSRVPAATTPTPFMRFADQGSPTVYDPIRSDVAAVVEHHGALFVARPVQPLRHARNYLLQVSANGADWFNAVTVQDSLGNSTTSTYWPGLVIATPGNLLAVPTAGVGTLLAATDQIRLSGVGSVTTQRPIVSYRWTQLSGTPLAIGTPNAQDTVLTWGSAPPPGVDAAMIQLTVTDAAGDTDSAQLTIRSANPASSGHVLYFRSAAGDYVGGGQTVLLGDVSGSFTDTLSSGYLQTLFYGNANSGSLFWNLALATSNGAPMTVGAYENAIRAPFRGSQNGIDFTGDGRGCNETSGRFDVLDIQTDATGAIVRLAVDFEQHCEGASAPALLGSYRINSTIPVRR